MEITTRKGLTALLLASASTCAMAYMDTARAQTCAFELPAQALRTGIPEFARQSGLQILVTDSDVGLQRGPAISGELDCRAALEVLISASNLQIVSDDGRTITLAAREAETRATGANGFGDFDNSSDETIVVVGSQIRGARVTSTLPVTVVTSQDMAASGATSGDELFRSIPQAGDVAFNESRTVGGVNDARGDTASINLRSLGTGNTLVLINGRRMVLHPGTQAENLVPVTTVNTNAIPVMGVERIEVLRDGASAIYGTDAVGGVVNTVLKSDFEGFATEWQYGGSEGTDSRELSASFEAGFDMNGRGNLSLFASYTDRDPLYAREREYSRNADQRSLVEGTEWEGSTAFRGTSTSTPWGTFDRVSSGSISQTLNGTTTVLTNTAGQFHIQPATLAGCRADLGGGLCVDDTTSIDEDLRYNINDERTLSGGVERYNFFTQMHYELTPDIEFFGELGVYYADYNSVREQAALLSAVRIAVPAANYYNPFGPATLNGAPNPSRLPGLSVPANGVDILLVGYRPIDVGPRYINVENFSPRVLTGLRGEIGGWDWESAYLYSTSETNDTTSNRISNTLFQEALARSTPDAYNPFNGGNFLDFANGDGVVTAEQQAAIDSFTIDVSRISHTSLASWDFKLSRPDVLELPAGGLGVATGIEIRRETFGDDRDPRLDGTISFTDPISGNSGSDVLGSSPTNDTSGARTVSAAYVELAIPLVSPDMNIPLVYSLDAQFAGRYEDYSLFGDVSKPKVALSWRPFEFLQFRTAWSEGFRAPNLQQLYETGLERVNTRTDYIRCEADLRAGRSTACGSHALSVTSQRAGSRDLNPELSENFTAGLTFETPFLPEQYGRLTFTADYWKVEQEDVIGILGDALAIQYDYLLRVLNDPANPSYSAVVRADPTAQDIADFQGTGLDPVGEILFVDDNYKNLLPREVEGVDIAIFYQLDDTPLGDFSLRLNAAQLLTFFQEPSEEAAAVINGLESGLLQDYFIVEGANSLVRQGGRPEWRWSGSLTWRKDGFGAGWYSSYVGETFETSATLNGEPWKVDQWLTHNLYGQYTFEHDTNHPTRVRVGVRNLTDEDPPLSPLDFGYNGELHNARGRYFYASVRKSF